MMFRSVVGVRVGVMLMLLMLCVSSSAVIHAQDNGASVDAGIVTGQPLGEIGASMPLVGGVVVVLAILLVGAMMYSSYITRFLATLVPPETASAIYASGVRFGLQVALNQAAQTPTPLDDVFFEEMARLRGLQVSKRPDGTYQVTQPL